MTKNSNVFVVDDDPSVRNSLRIMLNAAGYTVATLPSAEEFLVVWNLQTEGCIILDVNMSGMDGHTLQEELLRRGSRLPIIFLTGQGSIPLSVRAMQAGAVTFLTKPVDGKELLACIKKALDASKRLKGQLQKSRAIESRLSTLTKREKEVMMLAIQGVSSRDIAERLGISSRTVDNHRDHIIKKTNTGNMIELAGLIKK